MDRCTETASLISFETFQVDRDVRINVKTPPVMSKRYGFQYHVLVISGMLVKKPRFWDLNAELQAVGMCLLLTEGIHHCLNQHPVWIPQSANSEVTQMAVVNGCG